MFISSLKLGRITAFAIMNVVGKPSNAQSRRRDHDS